MILLQYGLLYELYVQILSYLKIYVELRVICFCSYFSYYLNFYLKMAKSVPLRLDVTSFSGDPEFLEFFIEQCNSKIKYCKWDNEKALTYIKSKLSGHALKFYVSSVPCRRSNTPNELFEIFRKHFKTESASSIAVQYNSIQFEPTESVNTFANRLESVVRKRFPQLPEASIAEILAAKFTDLIPTHLKIYLHTQKITIFEEMVESASTYQDILQSSALPSNTSNNLLPSYNIIHNFSTIPESQSAQNNRSISPTPSTSNLSSSAQVHHISSRNVEVVCQWCSKPNHTAQKCFRLQKITSSARHSSNYVNSKKFNRFSKPRFDSSTHTDSHPNSQPHPKPKPKSNFFKSRRNSTKFQKQPVSRQYPKQD